MSSERENTTEHSSRETIPAGTAELRAAVYLKPRGIPPPPAPPYPKEPDEPGVTNKRVVGV